MAAKKNWFQIMLLASSALFLAYLYSSFVNGKAATTSAEVKMQSYRNCASSAIGQQKKSTPISDIDKIQLLNCGFEERTGVVIMASPEFYTKSPLSHYSKSIVVYQNEGHVWWEEITDFSWTLIR